MADHDLKVSREERKKTKRGKWGERNEKQKAGVMNIKRYKGQEKDGNERSVI